MPPNQIHQGSWPLLAFAVVLELLLAVVLGFLLVMASPMQIRANTMTPTTKEITEAFTGEVRR